ncbi:Uncharacterised protein [Actinomyces howellii]|uniref:DUF4232 domain-containing protein n=1 Tax=Actinomyces howellii TaxID=52771 RepID=A0A448HGC8_9ACTO|nr:Uncharacterised protein [Actinomyces howellii]
MGTGVAVVAGLAYGLIAGALWVRDTIRDQDAAEEVGSAPTTYPAPTACRAADLDITVTVPETVATGAGMVIELAVVNSGAEPCLLDVGAQNLGAVITSGDHTVWTSTACAAGAPSRVLLVDAGDSTSTSLTWDGLSTDPACTGEAAAAPSAAASDGTTGSAADPATDAATDPASGSATDAAGDGATDGSTEPAAEVVADPRLATAGTYRVRIQVGGQDATSDQVFVVE